MENIFPSTWKKKQVIDLLKEKDLYEAVLDYHSFIFDLYPILSQKFNICEKVFSRVKTLNSLQSKIIKYIETTYWQTGSIGKYNLAIYRNY